MPKSGLPKLHLLALVAFSAALFLPLIGRGFIRDDFVHLCSVAYRPLSDGLGHVFAGRFYTPVTWLTFKIDWRLWGLHAFPFALENLFIHIANTLLLYCFALKWRGTRDYTAAWWTAFGFALLFPANVWAMLWISTRAHLLATFFYLAAMLAALWFTRTNRILALIALVVSAALSMFSKESGLTVIAAILLVVFHERRAQNQKVARNDFVLLAALLALLAVYLGLRAQSGAIPVTISGGANYSYATSPLIFIVNFLRYTWRTFGLLAFVAAAIVVVSFRFRRLTARLSSLTRHEILFPIVLFALTLTPFVLLPVRSGIYTYLPGIGAALLFGTVARALYASAAKEPGARRVIGLVPIAMAVIACAILTVRYSSRWLQMAEVNTAVLRQIKEQQPIVASNTFIVLTYSEIDAAHRFPEGFASWSFSAAVSLLYANPRVVGAIVREGEPYSMSNKRSLVAFNYGVIGNTPTVTKKESQRPY